jgi:uncharacterized RDD family membrane protein YckC
MDKESKNEKVTEKDPISSPDPDSGQSIHPTLLHKPNVSKETITQLKKTLSSILKEKQDNLSSSIEKIPIPPSVSPRTLLENETAHILNELNIRVAYWESVYLNITSLPENSSKTIQKHPRHLEIMALLHKIEKELLHIHEDIDVLDSDIHIKYLSSEILPLFDLLEKEFITPKRKINIKSTFSDSKTLDKSDLENELRKYESLVSKNNLKETGKKKSTIKKNTKSKKEDMSSLIKLDEDEYTEEQKPLSLEAPPLSSTALAFMFDFTLVLGGIVLYMFYQYPELRRLISKLPETPQLEPFLPLLIRFFIMLPSIWLLVLFISQVLYDGTLGQRLFGIVICNTTGRPPKISQLFIRIAMQALTVLTLGIRIIINIRKDRTFYCTFSKTRTALAASIPKEEETYLI